MALYEKRLTMKIICLISGGVDSTTLLFRLHGKGHHIVPLFVNYGQKSYTQEKNAAAYACKLLKLKLNIIDISGLSVIKSGLTHKKISIEEPFYPNRNLILLSIAAAFSVNHSCNVIAIGVIGKTNFLDQSKSFLNDAEKTLSYGRKIIILAPLSQLNKLEVVRLAKNNNIRLDFTYSCYCGSIPCQKCVSCIDRKKVFDMEDLNP